MDGKWKDVLKYVIFVVDFYMKVIQNGVLGVDVVKFCNKILYLFEFGEIIKVNEK